MKNKVATLGPEFSYSHIMASKLYPEGEIVFCQDIEEIYRKVKNGEVEIGVSPFENMIAGAVREAISSLDKYGLKIILGSTLPIMHCLASKSNNFNKIVSHTQALGQSSNFLKQFRDKGISVEETTSTSKAMEMACLDENTAAIGSEEAAKHYNLQVIERNVGNNKANVTRFIVISNEAVKVYGKNARSSMIISKTHDRPGLLYEILTPLAKNNINLTRIESVPSGSKLGEYNFYIEFDGCDCDENVKVALEELEKLGKIDFFGSYEIV